MVVMRLSPWSPPPATTTEKEKKKKKKRGKITIAVTRLELLPFSPPGEAARWIAVEAAWKRAPASGPLSLLARKTTREKKGRGSGRRVSRWKPVGNDGAVEWEEDDEANRFDLGPVPDTVPVTLSVLCGLSLLKSPVKLLSGVTDYLSTSSSITILSSQGSQQEEEGKGRGNKAEEIGRATVNLEEWAGVSQTEKQGEEVMDKKSQHQAQRKQVPITLRKEGWTSHAILYVDFDIVEVTRSQEIRETPSIRDDQMVNRKESKQKETTSDEQRSDDSFTSNSEIIGLDQLLQLADESDKLAVYGSRSRTRSNKISSSSSSNSGQSSPELKSISKRRFLPWRRRSRDNDNGKDYNEKESKKSQYSSPQKISQRVTANEVAESDKDEDPIGNWKSKEFISRDTQTKIKAQIFFASIDQRDESAGGESACTALVAVIADALHCKRLNEPTKSEFDALIREGSSEWRKLCEETSYIDRFPNKHFDLDTILDAKVRSISVLRQRSFIGFFQPESFESLSGAMSFDDIWHEISEQGCDTMVYIVSWNDHFFVLKVEDNEYYIIDTLGERLYEGCNKAYILKFDENTEMYKLPEKNGDANKDEIICRGKECCREFINRFLASIPLREELEIEKKGGGNNSSAPHQRLQIEFHFTVLQEEKSTDMRISNDEESTNVRISNDLCADEAQI